MELKEQEAFLESLLGVPVSDGKGLTDAGAFAIAMNCIAQGCTVPLAVALIVSRNWTRFLFAERASLTDAFGIPDRKHLSARKKKLNREAVFQAVKELQATGLPLKDSADREGALSIAAKVFSVSEKSVEAELTNYREERRAAGGDADREWKPVAELARGVAFAFSPTDTALLKERLAKKAEHIARVLPRADPKKSGKT